MDLEQIIFTIIVHAGNAKNDCFEALRAAKKRKFKMAKDQMEKAKDELLQAHHIQTDMLQKEAGGNKQELSLLLIHAEDHLMNAILAKDLIEEMIAMYQLFYERGAENIEKGA